MGSAWSQSLLCGALTASSLALSRLSLQLSNKMPVYCSLVPGTLLVSGIPAWFVCTLNESAMLRWSIQCRYRFQCGTTGRCGLGVLACSRLRPKRLMVPREQRCEYPKPPSSIGMGDLNPANVGSVSIQNTRQTRTQDGIETFQLNVVVHGDDRMVYTSFGVLRADFRISSASCEDNTFSRSTARERSLYRLDRHKSMAGPVDSGAPSSQAFAWLASIKSWKSVLSTKSGLLIISHLPIFSWKPISLPPAMILSKSSARSTPSPPRLISFKYAMRRSGKRPSSNGCRVKLNNRGPKQWRFYDGANGGIAPQFRVKPPQFQTQPMTV